MSLTEKFEALKKKEAEAENARKTADGRIESLKEYGLDGGRCDLEPVSGSARRLALFREAGRLIDSGKWNKARLFFGDHDILKDTVNRHRFAWLEGDKEAPYVKYKEEDGSIHCGAFMPAEAIVKGRIFSKKRRETRKALRNLAAETTAKRSRLVLHEDQDYVVLEYDTGMSPYRKSVCTFIMFEDGYVFRGEGHHRIVIDDFRIYAADGAGKEMLLEDWLIENVRRINAEPEKEKKE